MKRHIPHFAPTGRHGTIMPLLACAILAVCAAGALVLDRLWIDAAQLQLQAAAEAASLAAARRLADDDRLRESLDSSRLVDRARAAADHFARTNLVAGQSVALDLGHDGDIRFGSTVGGFSTGGQRFLETDVDPTTVIVTAQCLRQRHNALVLFFRGVTGQPRADAQAQAVAAINNRVSGIRPLPGSSVPCLPLGILEADPIVHSSRSWDWQIDRWEGQDRYGFDESTRTLLYGPDGIPEIVLNVNSGDDLTISTNVKMVDLGTNLHKAALKRQIASGVWEPDLQAWGGELLLSGGPVPVNSSTSLVAECLSDLVAQIGRTRICLLYQPRRRTGSFDTGRVDVTRLVAIRILTLEHADDGPGQIVVQPSVIATRAAVLYDAAQNGVTNPYIYNLSLTDCEAM